MIYELIHGFTKDPKVAVYTHEEMARAADVAAKTTGNGWTVSLPDYNDDDANSAHFNRGLAFGCRGVRFE